MIHPNMYAYLKSKHVDMEINGSFLRTPVFSSETGELIHHETHLLDIDKLEEQKADLRRTIKNIDMFIKDIRAAQAKEAS